MSGFEHVPVMPGEVIEALQVRPDGVYVDCTLGGGGHSALIYERLTTGRLIGIDRDADAIRAASARISASNFSPVRGNFHELPAILDRLDISPGTVDGILMDLGVSSHQIDTPGRGFSFRQDGPLDMRMDKDSTTSAHGIVHTYSEKELAKIFFEYGEERHSRRIARAICKHRETAPIETTLTLAQIIEKATPKTFGGPHPAMRTFMALRIAVNDELSPLSQVLQNAADFLKKDGRIAVITFHSLEDRIVKTTFAKLANPCQCPRDIPYCVCGKTPQLKIITKKPITPSPEELTKNTRAHSAKLRAATKL